VRAEVDAVNLETTTGYCLAMGRRINKLTFGPAGICDACGKRCVTLDQVGIPCFHCEGQGVFMHRQFWTFSPCPECGGECSSTCGRCNGVGCLVAAKEDVDLEALRRAWRQLLDRYQGGAVPPAVRTASAQADVTDWS
jgi:DnaJ-class molecular chaperone